MNDSRKFMLVAIPSAFIGFVILISVLTGSNPIDSFFLLIGRTVMYIGMLFIFGAPVLLLAVLVSVTWNEMVLARTKDDENPKRKKRPVKKNKKVKGKVNPKAAAPPQGAKPIAKKAKG